MRRAPLLLSLVAGFFAAVAPVSAWALVGPVDSVEVLLRVIPGGTMQIRETYNFRTKSPDMPEDFSIWIPAATRSGLLYREMQPSFVRVEAANGAPIPFNQTRTPNGISIDITNLPKYFEYGPSLTFDVTLTHPFSTQKFSARLLEHDRVRSELSNFTLEIQWPGGAGDLQLIDAVLDHVNGKAKLERIEGTGGRVLLGAPGVRDIKMPLSLDINGLIMSEVMAPSRRGLGPMFSAIWNNTWFFIPFSFVLVLGLLGWTFAREEQLSAKKFNPSPRPPAGMEPGTAAILLHGGISARTYASAALWFAHRGKVHLEMRPESQDPLMGMVISKRADADANYKDYERAIWNNLLFEGVDSNSLRRLGAELSRRGRRHVLRRKLARGFPLRAPLLKPQAREWWLWSRPYQATGIAVVLLGITILAGFLSFAVPDVSKAEWIFTFPVMVIAGYLFMDRADWQKSQPAEEDTHLLQFASFLNQEPRALRDLRGNVAAFSFLLPYAVATGTERALMDAYTFDQRTVSMPGWFMVYGTADTVHGNVLRELLGDYIEGMLACF